jgi:hypothetical protein
MLTTDPHGSLALAHDRTDRLVAEAAANRLRARSGARHALAALLRGAADRLEAGPPAPRTPLRPPILVNVR